MEVKTVKLLVWDLDDTLWRGTLLEGDAVEVAPTTARVLTELDQRGVLHSIASKNEPGPVLAKLSELGLADYFLLPQVGWGAKSAAIRRLVSQFGFGLDAVAFVDDQPFECAEVAAALPEVRIFTPADLPTLTDRPEFRPRYVTDESAKRRWFYRADLARSEAEETFEGPSESFLASLGMRLTISAATATDLERAEELCQRTHQLNSTGVPYTLEELNCHRLAADRRLLVARLEDRFGDYGTIGLALVQMRPEPWRLKLLITSCRVISRGIGFALLHYLLEQAAKAGTHLQAELRTTGRNRPMRVVFALAGFREVSREGETRILERSPADLPPTPSYLDLRLEEQE